MRAHVLLVLAACASRVPVTSPTSAPLERVPVPLPARLEVATPDEAEAIDAATAAVVRALASGQPAAVVDAFDPTLGTAPTAAQIGEAWAGKTRGLGALRAWSITDRTQQDGFDTRIVRLELEHGALQCLVSLVPDTHRIASLYLAAPAPPARYVDAARFQTRELVVGADPAIRLPGTLALPRVDGRVPAVVLVHGSGPNDRDASTGANKIFKDLGEGLATAGIATLRYEKRTFRHAPDPLTIDDEVVDDAVDAVRVLAAQPEIDPARIVVVGHSLGALLAPEIAVRAQAAGVAVAGAVLLAPPGRPPWDIVLGQMRYLNAPPATIKAIELAITVINIGGGEGQTLLGIPFAYWRDWASRDGIARVKQLGKPVLVLHGDRDYQVLEEDFTAWRRGLAGVAHVAFASLAGDDHLFIRGRGPPSPLAYKVPGHVDERAVARIVAFVRGPW